MDRTQNIVIVVVAVAVALFGLRVLIGRSPTDEPAGSERPGDRRSLEGAGSDAERGADGVASERWPDDRPSRESREGGAADARGGTASAAKTRKGTDSASVVAGGGSSRSSRHALAGTPGGPRDAASVEPQVSAGAAGGRRLAPREERRSEVLEFLASQPPSAGQSSVAGETKESEGDLVLSVPLAQSTEAEDGTKPAVEKGVELSEEGVGITFKDGSVLTFPNAGNARGEAGSIAFDVAPEWTGADDTNNSFVQIRTPHQWENVLALGKNGRFFRFILTDNTGQETDISVPINSWTPGERHRVVATWGEARTALYIDGRLVGQNTYPGELRIAPGTPMYLGSDLPGGAASAQATFQDFKVFGRALTPEEISSR